MTFDENLDRAIDNLDEWSRSFYENWRKDHPNAPTWEQLDPDPANRIEKAADVMEAEGD